MKKLKILHVAENFFPIYGGVTSVVDQLCEMLSDYADVYVATVTPSLKKGEVFNEPERKYKIVRCKGYKNKFTGDMIAQPSSDKNFKKFIEETDFDVVHCHFPLGLASFVSKIAKKRGIPVIYTIHSLYWYDIKYFTKSNLIANLATRIAVERVQKNADYIWVVSEYCKNFLKKYGLKNKAEVVYNCTSTKDDNLKHQSTLSQNSLNEEIPKHQLTLLEVGRLVKIKNLDLILNSLFLLKNKNLDIQTYFVGGGPYQKKLMEKVKKYGLEDQVIFTGPITDRNVLQSYYSKSDLILFPSCADSAGLIHVEGALYNKPTLAVENTAISERIKDNVNGFVSKNNAISYSKKIMFAFNHKKKLVSVGKKARKSLVKLYTDPKIAIEIFKKYLNAIALFKKKNA